ncbi:aspartate aminotransferase family protein [Flavobacterium sp. NKUCC04_CG]|uniref:aspartate aminotransferase family protein n=1 Tax=Flavobacterium sp. NKUCC04_CG TaxID=2842121 RepID=UPI001C5AD172|nr:aminotransferase class III-fold pyridoxal phosphate-dependent enzyme [Flavobacterium sp. NKUCC04_CG]MBW3518900.1 aminotransferase class III-fold pyridoxal phosphate-dependent enzyme [Flavobacterium sp. NKUCC04_CG]
MILYDVYPLNPIEITKGLGSHVFDQKGTDYLDMYGGHAVISIGHSHPHYVKKLTQQLQNIGFYSNSIEIPLQGQLAEKLGALSNANNRQLFLCNSGAEANENALKLASFYNGRKRVIAFSGAFHGRTSLAVTVTDNPKIAAPINQTSEVSFLPFNDVEALEKVFRESGETIAAVIVEGIQGVGGIQVATDQFLQTIRKLTSEYDAIFIADEVQSGYGRTGSFYAVDHSGVEADIYTMAKGMGNGFPIGALSICDKIKPWHGQLGTTFGGNHLACIAAISVLEVMQQEQLMSHAQKMGDYLMSELKKLPLIKEVRGRGLMIGIALPVEWANLQKELLFQDHIFTGNAGSQVIRLLPALNLSYTDADRFLECFSKRLQKY